MNATTTQIHDTRRRPDSAELEAFFARDLGLLTAIENTKSRLSDDARLFNLFAEDARKVDSLLQDAEPKELLDPDRRIANIAGTVLQSTVRIHDRLNAQLDSARTDSRLTEEDGLAFDFVECIAAVEAFHDAFAALVDRIDMLDAIQSPIVNKTYTNVDDMWSDLGI